MRTMVGNELSFFKDGAGFSSITFSGLNGQIIGFVGDEKHGIGSVIPVLGSHYYPSSGRVLYDGYEFNQKGGEVKMPLEICSDGSVFPSVSFVERIFASSKFTLSRSQLIQKYFPDIPVSSMKKLSKLPSSAKEKVINFCAYLSFSHGVFLLDSPFKSFSDEEKKKGMIVLRELADRFKEIYIIAHNNLEDLKSFCDLVIDLNTSEEVFAKIEATEETEVEQ